MFNGVRHTQRDPPSSHWGSSCLGIWTFAVTWWQSPASSPTRGMAFPGKKKKKESRFKSRWLRFPSFLHSAPCLGHACISLHAKPHLGSILCQWRFPLQSTVFWFYSLALRGPSYSRRLGFISVPNKYWQTNILWLVYLGNHPKKSCGSDQ